MYSAQDGNQRFVNLTVAVIGRKSWRAIDVNRIS